MLKKEQTTKFSPKRLATNAILIAVFFVLSLFSVEIGGVKLTFDSLPVVLAAALFGPVDAFLVGLLGAFLEQMLRYGFTATTLLWILPPATRGLVAGLGMLMLRRAQLRGPVARSRRLAGYFAACLLAAVVTSLLNTAVYYVDAKLYGYYNYALIFGALAMRIVTGLLSGALTAAASLPVLAALQKAGIPVPRRPQEDQIG